MYNKILFFVIMQIENYEIQQGFCMKCILKYMYIFMMVGLCLNAPMMMASEWILPIPPVSSMDLVTEIPTKNIVEKVMSPILGHMSHVAVHMNRDPKVLLLQLSAGCVALMSCYMLGPTLYKTADEKLNHAYNAVKRDIKSYIEGLPAPIQVIIKPITFAVDFACGMAKNYIANNIIFVGAAGGFVTIGWISGFPIIGGGLGGASLMAGLILSMWQDFREQGKQIRDEAQKNKEEVINKISQEVGSLSDQITEVREQLTTQIDTLSKGVNVGMEGIDSKLTVFSVQLSDLKTETVKIADRLTVLHKDNIEKDEKIEYLLGEIKRVNDNLNLAKQSFDKMITGIAEKVDNSSNAMEQGFQSTSLLLLKLGTQVDQVVSEQAKQNENDKCVLESVNNLLNTSENHKTLLSAVQSQLKELVDKEEKCNTDQNILLKNILQSQTESDNKNKTSLDDLATRLKKTTKQNKNSIKSFFEGLEGLRVRISSLEAQSEQRFNNLYAELCNMRQELKARDERHAQELRARDERHEKGQADLHEEMRRLHAPITMILEGQERNDKRQERLERGQERQAHLTSDAIETVQHMIQGRRPLEYLPPQQERHSFYLQSNTPGRVIGGITSRPFKGTRRNNEGLRGLLTFFGQGQNQERIPRGLLPNDDDEVKQEQPFSRLQLDLPVPKN